MIHPDRQTHFSSVSETETWSPNSWRSKAAMHQVQYRDQAAMTKACNTLSTLPPLISPTEIEGARTDLAEVARGNAFIIQGGDCAESFEDVQFELIAGKRKLLAEQSRLLSKGLNVQIIQIGRIAGQYAKPRSEAFQIDHDGKHVETFKGHNINSVELDAREPNPMRLLLGYFNAATTLLTLNTVATKPGLKSASSQVDLGHLYTSHEALHLPLESAQTKGRYNTSAAFVWIGERTRQVDGAHMEYVRGLRNPIGIKISSRANPKEIVRLLDILDPLKQDIGRITLITRLGNSNVERGLPAIIEAVRASGHTPIWMCDPCHGCTEMTSGGVKIRRVLRVLDELKQTFAVHQRLGTYLGGVHLEQTGENVSECLSGLPLADEDELVAKNYRSLCDPRLSGTQAVDVVRDFVEFVGEYKRNLATPLDT